MDNPRITDLIEAVAKATGLRSQSVFQCARTLRENGLISQKDRGRGAATMMPADAANLLIGVMASEAWPEAPRSVRLAREAAFVDADFRGLSAEQEQEPNFQLPFYFMADPKGGFSSFGDAIELIIVEMIQFGDPVGFYGLPIENLFVQVTRPGLKGVIQIAGEIDVKMEFHRNDPRFDGLSPEQVNSVARELFAWPSMSVKAEVGMESLWTVAECLMSDEQLAVMASDEMEAET